jgi:hypothetical protein
LFLVHRFAQDTPALSAEDLAELRERLGKMPDDKLRSWYNDCLNICQLDSRGHPPKAAYPQQLIQAWKELDRRRKLAKST